MLPLCDTRCHGARRKFRRHIQTGPLPVLDTDRQCLASRVASYLGSSSFAVAIDQFPTFNEKFEGYAPHEVWREVKKIGFDDKATELGIER
jgi:hypothetical protein